MMTAIRFGLAPLAMLAFAGLGFAQMSPLRDPVRHVATITDADVYSPRPLELNEVELNVEDAPGEIVTWEPASTDVESMHPPAIACETCTACNEHEKHCEGVCRDPGRPKKPKMKKPGDRNRGDCPPLRYRMDDCKRAGNPHSVAKWAKCGVNGKYSSWFVGGGAAFFRGRHRTPAEGTWGLDYDGWFGHTRNWLKYTRGRKQGGEGAYRTDGEPKVVSKAHEILHLGH